MARTLLITAIFALFLYAACASQQEEEGPQAAIDVMLATTGELARLLPSIIEDHDRANRAVSKADEMKVEVKARRKVVRGLGKRLIALNANYDAEPAEFRRLFEEQRLDLEERSERMTALVIGLREDLTPEEWSILHERVKRFHDSRKASRD